MSLGVAAICFIVDGDRILLMQAPWAGNLWSVIGGKVEPGETPDQAVCREVFEETGLTLVQYRSAGDYLLEEADGHATRVYVYVSTRQTGELRGSEEGEPIWWPIAEGRQLPLVEPVGLVWDRVLTVGGNGEEMSLALRPPFAV